MTLQKKSAPNQFQKIISYTDANNKLILIEFRCFIAFIDKLWSCNPYAVMYKSNIKM